MFALLKDLVSLYRETRTHILIKTALKDAGDLITLVTTVLRIESCLFISKLLSKFAINQTFDIHLVLFVIIIEWEAY